MVKRILAAAFLSLMSLNGCSKVDGADEQFSFSPSPNLIGSIFLKGYYYYYYAPADYYIIMFLYSNGVILYGAAVSTTDLLKTEDSYKNGTFHAMAVKDISLWRIYKVEGDSIRIEARASDGTTPLIVGIYEGVILNDSTFTLLQSRRLDGRLIDKRNETYHFKSFSPKPDSTNPFIK